MADDELARARRACAGDELAAIRSEAYRGVAPEALVAKLAAEER